MEKMARGFLGAIDFGSKMTVPTTTLAQAMMNNTFKLKEKSIEILENGDITWLGQTGQ